MTNIKDYLNDMAHEVAGKTDCNHEIKEADLQDILDEYAQKILDLIIRTVGHGN